MTAPIIGDCTLECSWCGTWHKTSARVCPKCKRPNPDFVDKNERFHNRAPHGAGPVTIEREKKYEDD